MQAPGETGQTGGARPFPATTWGVLQAGGADRGSPAWRAGLETLVRNYWGPVYFFVRRHWARDPDEAQDLVQSFFTVFLEQEYLADFDAARGRFRTFVCAALKHFLANQKRAAGAKKRAPDGRALLSFDALKLEDRRFDVPAAASSDPEIALREEWKQAVVRSALDRLAERARGTAREPVVPLFVRYDLDRPEGEKLTYDGLAREAGLSVGQVTAGLHWARKQFQELFLAELAEQTTSPEEMRAEARELFGIEVPRA